MQAGGTHPQLPGTGPQAQAQARRQDLRSFLDLLAFALHLAQAER